MSSFHDTDCARIEAMLPAFVAHELVGDERTEVAKHLESCARCREALAALAAIEATLVARRDEIPSVDAFLPDRFAAHSPASARRPVLVKVFRAVMSTPGIAILLVMWSALLIAHFQGRVASGIEGTTVFDRMQAFGKRGIDAMVAAAGGDTGTLTAVYGALAIAVIVSAGALTVRFVRS
jgi:anti-sigma factor RsiW